MTIPLRDIFFIIANVGTPLAMVNMIPLVLTASSPIFLPIMFSGFLSSRINISSTGSKHTDEHNGHAAHHRHAFHDRGKIPNDGNSGEIGDTSNGNPPNSQF